MLGFNLRPRQTGEYLQRSQTPADSPRQLVKLRLDAI